MQVTEGQGGTVVSVDRGGVIEVEDTDAAWMRERGVMVNQAPEAAGSEQARDAQGRWA